MDISRITDDYSVTPQISPADIPAIVEAGFKSVICNRPDDEVEPDKCSAEVEAAVKAAGLTWLDNPFSSPALTMTHVEAQRTALATLPRPVLAYCRSGTRCTVVWALAQAQAGTMPADQVVAAAAEAGFDVSHLRPTLDALAKS